MGLPSPQAAAGVEGTLREIQRQRAFVDELSRNPATASGDIEGVARLVTECCARLLGVERVGVWLFDESETQLRCVDQYNLSTGAHVSGALIHEQEFRAELFALKTSLYVDASDPYTDPRTAGYVEGYLKVNGITSMLDVVVRFGGRNLGTLCFEHVGPRHTWRQDEIDFGCMIGCQLSVLLERRAQREVSERLVATQELDALKSRFLANVSHELRTPLTLLLGPLEELLEGDSHPPSAWQRDQLAAMRRNGRRLLKLVDALLDFVRLEAGRMKLSFEPTDLGALTREVTALFASAAQKAGIRLSVASTPLCELGWVDRDTWEKIVSNLVANALKYTLAGEVLVEVSQNDRGFELVVRDTGIGIPAEALPHLFERFYRVPDAGGRTVEGAGIGLALVKDLASLHGGTVEVESRPGAGSTFRVRIPRGHQHLPPERVRDATPGAKPLGVEEDLPWLPSGAPDPAPAAGTGRARILIADDNADMRTFLARQLAGAYEVEVVEDGEAALTAARERPPDLVLADVMMPRLDGIGLVRALRADPATCGMSVVVISARAGDDACAEALDVGADDYIAKPFSSRELRARVAAHLALSRARREAAESALKDVFIGLAGHELRTPLTTLKLRLEVARRKLAEGKAAESAVHLGHMERSMARLEQLTGALLSVSAIQRGRLSLVRERCDLRVLCRVAAEGEEMLLGRRVTLDLPEGPLHAVVDRDRLVEVIEHLLANALKFSPRERPVTLSLRSEGDDAVIAVRDEGPGIPSAEVPHIFERFHRVPGIEVQVGSNVGLGLGLFTAKALVEQHGGRIAVLVNDTGGSTFVVTLPREV